MSNCDGEDFDETLVFDEDGLLTSGTTPITDIPVGTQCSVTETDAGGADSVTYDPNGGTAADPPTVTIDTEGETVTVTVTNTFDQEVGSLDVVKDVTGLGDPGDTTFTITVDCDDDAFDETLVFNEDESLASGTTPITEIPLGTSCTVTETDDGGADSVTYDPNGGTAADPPTVTIDTEGETVTVTVTNNFDQEVGSLDVVKDITGLGDPGDTTFTITVDCDDDAFDETLVFDEDENLVSGTTPITDIPLGTQCSVTETGDGGADLVTYDPNGGMSTDPPTVAIMTEGETVTVTVTNTFDQEVGQLDVAKVVSGAGSPAPGATFTIDVDCDDTEFDETLTFDDDGLLQSGTSPITGIPLGTQCSVTESGTGGADSVTYDPNGGTAADPPTVTIDTEGETVTVTVTNTFDQEVGSLDVVKDVTGAGDPGDTTFTITVNCDDDAFDETLVFDEDENLTSGTTPITDIPLGTSAPSPRPTTVAPTR